MENKYYDYSWIKNKKKLDLDNEIPAIYLISSNRTSGKTTGGLKLCLEDFIESGKKIILLFRYQYELSSAASLFDDVLSIYKFGKEMVVKSHAGGLFYEIFIDEKSCGFSIALSNPDSLKKYSPIFKDCQNIFMDEFSTESGRYLPDEIGKFQSILMTISRGGGEQSRYMRVIMCSNFVTLMNPYFVFFNIHTRVNKNTHFLRGHGWIAHFDENEHASTAVKENRLFAAFSNSTYMKYSTENIYLHDNLQFVEKMDGKFKRVCVIREEKFDIIIEHFFNSGLLHCRKVKTRQNDKVTYTGNVNVHDTTTVLINRNTWICKTLIEFYNKGLLRFSDFETKSVIFSILGIAFFDK